MSLTNRLIDATRTSIHVGSVQQLRVLLSQENESGRRYVIRDHIIQKVLYQAAQEDNVEACRLL
jgi:hypothetical protein